MTLVWIDRFSRMNSAPRVAFACIPPTLAAASTTYSGLSEAKKASTAAESSSGSSLCVRVSTRAYPSSISRRVIAEPTIPRCPAT